MALQREFENGLVPGSYGGAAAIAAFLSRTQTPGLWNVAVFAIGAPSPCTDGMYDIACVTGEGAQGFSVSRPTNSTIRLEGSTTANNPNAAAVINRVSSSLLYCQQIFSPVACATTPQLTGYEFTEATVSPAIPIRNGQVIQFSVVFSFSSVP